VILFKENSFRELLELAGRKPPNIRFGPTSWNYQGWRGLVFWRSYKSIKHFTSKSIEEVFCFPLFSFAEVDFTYYAPPTPQRLAKFFCVPSDFHLIFKVTRNFMDPNSPEFLNYAHFERFLEPFSSLRDKQVSFHLQFSYLKANKEYILDKVLEFASKKSSELKVSIEFRNADYLDCLSAVCSAGLIPTLNHWTFMPPLSQQAIFLPPSVDRLYIRLLTPKGVSYAQAVTMFQPYSEIKTRNLKARDDLTTILKSSTAKDIFIAVNNRFEGCGPLTIKEIIEDVTGTGRV
jgi:uncharacterized protein YecE (DUF72 family)